MKTEKEKMLAGELYDPLDPQLSDERVKARLLLKELNDSREDQPEERARILKELIPDAGAGLWLQPPFYCDYGTNIKVGDRVFFNFNCVVLDVMQVTIGSRTMFGPNVQIYTATHPLNHIERASGVEYAKPITIGEDVWVGGSVVVCPGVSIGDRSVIGAGSVVTKDIPPDVFAAGNPCRVIRQLAQGA
jgi:maltose O-acetyltransferase